MKIFEKKILSLPINKLESEINEINSKEFIEFIKEGRNEFDRIFIFNVSDLYIEEKKEEKIRNLEESIEFLKEEIIYYEDEEMTYFLEKQIQEESELIDKIELMSNEEFEKDYIPYFFISEEEIKEEVIEEINYDTDGKYINEIRENYPSEFEKKIYILEKQLANPNEKEYILNQIDILNKEIEFYKSQSQEEIMNKEIKEFRIIGKLLDGRYFSDLRFSSYIIIDSKFEKIEYTDEEVEELRNDTILELERRIDVLKVILEIYNDEYINDQISYIENEIELIKIQSIETLRSKFFYERIPFIPTNISNITETIITENIIINQTNVSNITETIITENITSEIVNNSIRDNIINKTEVVVENIKNISEKIIEQIKDDTNENNKSLNLIETDNKEEIVKNDKDNPIQSINKLNQNTNKLNESSIKNSKKDENTNFFITQFNSVTEFFSNLFNFFRE